MINNLYYTPISHNIKTINNETTQVCVPLVPNGTTLEWLYRASKGVLWYLVPTHRQWILWVLRVEGWGLRRSSLLVQHLPWMLDWIEIQEVWRQQTDLGSLPAGPQMWQAVMYRVFWCSSIVARIDIFFSNLCCIGGSVGSDQLGWL